MNIRLAIADDHHMIIQGLRHILLQYPYIELVGTYSNGAELLRGLESEVPDVLLLDIQMPGKTGDELVEIILELYPSVKILALTNYDSTLYIRNMFKYGAHGYLLKTTEEKTLIEAITTVYQGGEFIEAQLKDKMEQELLKTNRAVSTKPKLSTREKEVLQLIVDGNTDEEIAKTIFLSPTTVRHYRISILLKMDAKNAASLTKKALQLGLAK
jgi:DNA-binding NarL/FixJ family response regulator